MAVHHEGFLYAYSARLLVCVDAATGELRWRSRTPGDGFITLLGDMLLILTKDGTLHVARATPEGYDELASATILDEPRPAWGRTITGCVISTRGASDSSPTSVATCSPN